MNKICVPSTHINFLEKEGNTKKRQKFLRPNKIMNSPQRPPLSSLNPRFESPYGPAYPSREGPYVGRPPSPRALYPAKGSSAGQYVLWFVILAALIWLGLYLLKPRAVLKKDAAGQYTGDVDPMKVFWIAVLTA